MNTKSMVAELGRLVGAAQAVQQVWSNQPQVGGATQRARKMTEQSHPVSLVSLY